MMAAYTKAECRSAAANLTPRQRQVLAALAEGKPRKVIAEDLNISPGTVNAHLEDIYRRLNIQADTQAVRVACAAGLV